MARVDYEVVPPKQRRQFLDELADIVAHIRQPKDARYFLERLLTENEVVMLYRRLQVAELLVAGRTYEQIQRQLKVGTATIRSVDGWLTDAAYEYKLLREHQRDVVRLAKLKRRNKKLTEAGHRESTLPLSFRRLLRHDSRYILLRLLLGDP